MRRMIESLTFALMLAAVPAAAETVDCPHGQPPGDAQPTSQIANRYMAVLGQVFRSHHALGAAASTGRYCLTRAALFYDPEWLPEDTLRGPPERSKGFVALAYLVGVYHARFSRLGGEHPPTADHAGAWFAGCALAEVGARGDDVARLVADLAERTGPRDDDALWQNAAQKGYGSCVNK